MATRLYLPATGVAAISPTVDAGWDAFLASSRRPTATTKTDTALTNVGWFDATPAAPCDIGARQYVSDTLDVDQTIAGTLSLVDRVDGAVGSTAHLAYVVRVIKPDLAVRGTLISVLSTTATAWSTTAETRIASAVALSAVAALAGDRLVLELGEYKSAGGDDINQTIMRFGDPTATADFALTSGLTTDLCPWFEFSQNITFGVPLSAALTGTAMSGLLEENVVSG